MPRLFSRVQWVILALAVTLAAGCSTRPDVAGDESPPANFHPVIFPADFLWGTASSAYQVEGNYKPDGSELASNWSRWEEMGRISGRATNPRGADFFHRYEEDFGLSRSLGANAYRMGISWERVEPAEGEWDEEAIAHYVRVVKAAHEQDIQVMVTFYHWVVPRWVSDPSLPASDPGRDQFGVPGNEWLWNRFAAFTAKVVPHIAPYVDLYSITNEPWSMVAGYVAGVFPPGDTLNLDGAQALISNLTFMTARAAREIRRLDTVDATGDGVAASIGVAKEGVHALPYNPDSAADRAAADRYNYVLNDMIVDAWTVGTFDANWNGTSDDAGTVPPEGTYAELANTLDWIGVNFYGSFYVMGAGDSDDPFGGVPIPFGNIGNKSGYPVSEMNTELRPGVFVATLEHYWARYGLPIYITENGIGDCDDNQRERYLVEHLYGLGRAMDAGIDIRGYFQWSLTDNFEWAHGFDQCFGLFQVDFGSFERTKRPSANAYAEIIDTGGINFDRFRRGFKAGYGNDHTGRTLEENLAEIESEIANGIEERAVYPR